MISSTLDEIGVRLNIRPRNKKNEDLSVYSRNINQILNWNGRLDSFKSFDEVIEKIIDAQETKNQAEYNNKVVDWIKSFDNNINEIHELKKESVDVETIPEYYNYIPTFTTSKRINPKYYLTGEISCEVYNQIDGRKSINQISSHLNVKQNQVYNICKNLIKMGFISLN